MCYVQCTFFIVVIPAQTSPSSQLPFGNKAFCLLFLEQIILFDETLIELFEAGLEVIKLFFVLNSAEHEISTAN